jgi:hypothetical protein
VEAAMTGGELEQRNIQVMGEDLGKQYTALFKEVTILHLYWKEFFELFGTNEKRIDRLNETAPNFFRMLQDQQFETNMLNLARLTDLPETGRKTNLTVRSLPNLFADEALKKRLVELVDDVEVKTEFCRDWRNRHFAHRDLMLAMEDCRAVPLASATKERIFDALRVVSDLMNEIERFYFRGACSFEDIAAHRGAAALLSVMGFGVLGIKRMKEKIANKDFAGIDAPESI